LQVPASQSASLSQTINGFGSPSHRELHTDWRIGILATVNLVLASESAAPLTRAVRRLQAREGGMPLRTLGEWKARRREVRRDAANLLRGAVAGPAPPVRACPHTAVARAIARKR
jgi:hypothetical protein